MDASYRLAQHTVELDYGQLPAEVVNIVKQDILDTIGVAIAGASEPGGEELMRLVEDWGGKEESTVIGFGRKVPAPLAALVNGTTAHALDYDDVILSTGHLGVTIIPAALAIAERVGQVSGKDLITAVTLGTDIMCRLGEATQSRGEPPGWLYTPLYGVFGAATAAGKLLNLDQEQMVNAFGLAYSHAAGTRQPIYDGALSKRMAAGFSAKSGVFSALAAKQGITGAHNCFNGKFGLFNVYHQGKYNDNQEILLGRLGEYFPVANLSFKKFPACSATETAVEATLELIEEHGIRAEDVEKITVHVSEFSRNCSEPLEFKQNPRAIVDAQFSIPWTVATALVKRSFMIEDMAPEAIHNAEVREMARKVFPVVDMEAQPDSIFCSIVEIRTKGSDTVYSKRMDVPTGHPKRPMSWDDLIFKFKDCAKHGRKPTSEEQMETIVAIVRDLENVKDVGELIRMLA